MNEPIRKLAVFCAVLFLCLLVSTSWIQFGNADNLKKHPKNTRSYYATLGMERGSITAQDTIIAESVESDSRFSYQRRYPAGAMYGHITGYYAITARRTQLEQAEDSVLTGSDASQAFEKLSDLLTGKKHRGYTVETTIDPKIQRLAWNSLGDNKGAIVAIRPDTGAIVAMVSKPSYDPNLLASHNMSAVKAEFSKLNNDKNKPLISRAFGAYRYPPGSVFKLVTAAAAMEKMNMSADTMLKGPASIPLKGTSRTLSNSTKAPCGPGGSEDVSLKDSIKVSCNTSFAQLALDLGAKELRNQADKFGMLDKMNIPMQTSSSSVPGNLQGPELARAGIGQGDVQVTPLHIAAMTAAIANGGELMQPTVKQAEKGRDLKSRQQAPVSLGSPISAQTASQLRQMMVSVVNESGGTGSRARIEGVQVAGKTGTADHAPNRPPHAWFTGFAPADGNTPPKIAVAVVVQEGGGGGKVAAPIARKIMKEVLKSES